MTRTILPLILILVLTSQFLFSLANAEDSNEYNDSTLNQQVRAAIPPGVASTTSDNAAAQYYSLGVIEYNEGNVELAKVWFQRAYESLEAEVGKPPFRGALDKSPFLAAPAIIQFPEGYKVNVYYRDGWYTQPRSPLVGKERIYSFLAGSTYKIRVEPENEQSAPKRINAGTKIIAALVIISWLMAR